MGGSRHRKGCGEGPWFRLNPHARQRQFARRCFFCMMCTKKLVLHTWQSAPHYTISSESHFFILNKPYVSCSVKVDLSPICASRRKAWHLAPALRKDSDIPNTDISSTQAWRQTWWRCHLDPNVSRHHRSTRMSENNPAHEPDELRSINCFIVCSKCIGGCRITQQLWTQGTQYV